MLEVRPQIDDLEKTIAKYIRCDVVKDANAQTTAASAAFNAWIEAENDASQREQASFTEAREALEASERDLGALRRTLEVPPANDDAAVDAYNARVRDFNQQSQALQARTLEYNARIASAKAKAQERHQEVERRRHEADQVQTAANAHVMEYQAWLDRDGSACLWTDINALLARVTAERRSPGASATELVAACDQLHAFRHEIGDWVAQREANRDNGLIIVRCKASGMVVNTLGQSGNASSRASESEEVFMLVDCGATVSSISPEMVRILDLEKDLRDEVELRLPNGLKTKARQLLIPSLSFAEQTAAFVEGVMLQVLMAGVDGSLALNFLNRFDYQISKGAPSTLTLKRAPVGPEARDFDVFISYKSEDGRDARKVFDLLGRHGYRPFLSEISLIGMGEQFVKVIDQVVENVKHMVVVASSRKHMEAPWVEREWRMFEVLQIHGESNGHLVSVLCGDMHPNDLPPALRPRQAVQLVQPGWDETLLGYLPR